jgi:ribosomal protein S18 acetylase RimI-like enzyme
MAALSDAPLPVVVELSETPANELNRLLEEEIDVWDTDLSWDFRPSSELVRRFAQMQSLQGFGLRLGDELIGYAYQVCDERKGLIGDFYVRPTRFSPSNELILLNAVVGNLIRTPGVRRIESQLMLMRSPSALPLPFPDWVTRHDRYFMEISRESIVALAPRPISQRVRIQGWTDKAQEEAAHVISASYKGHVDSEINDQYRSIPGARRFLTNIVRYPGCGRFCPPASFVAIDEHTGKVCGICLSSTVSQRSAHITQVCVLPALRGTGVGYELLRASVQKLADLGYQSVSLTVTCMNVNAIRMYEAFGFRQRWRFPALVWENF